MQFNSETNNLDIVSDIKFWCGIASTDTTSYPLKAMARNSNFGLDKVVSLILRSDQTWQWDDLNSTDTPIGTKALVSAQKDYSIDVTHLKILKVRIKDSAGNWISLNRIDRRDLTDFQLTASDGVPTSYDKFGNSIRLNPAPNYASAGGLEVQFQRGASYFAYDSTTKEPGFASQFHRLVPLYASLDYLEANGPEKREAKVRVKIMQMEEALVDFYSSRNMDEKQSFTLRKDDYGEIGLSDDYSPNPKGF